MTLLYKENWKETEKNFKLWWEGKADKPLVQIFVQKEKCDVVWDGWDLVRYWKKLDVILKNFETFAKCTAFLGEAYPNLWINLGAGVLAAYLGASPRFISSTVWFETPKNWEELENLEIKENNEWWSYTKEVARELEEKSKNKFVAGMTDIGGILDVAASLRGTNNLMKDLYLSPRKVKSLLDRIIDLWHYCYDEIYDILRGKEKGTSAWMNLWSPLKWYPIQCDYAYMLSPKLFKEFVSPYVMEQCERLDHPLYHLDGVGQIVHLDELLRIEKLRGIQWVPGAGKSDTSSEVWIEMYKKIISKGKLLVIDMPFDKVNSFLSNFSSREAKSILIQTWTQDHLKALELLTQLDFQKR
jgi:5-methyltetrahydrofolate--homocysteine methyltransferase